jgi:hypothetical protein
MLDLASKVEVLLEYRSLNEWFPDASPNAVSRPLRVKPVR